MSVTFNRSLPIVCKISAILADSRIVAYVVGGYVRDCLIRKDTEDIDIALKGDAIAVAGEVALAIEGKCVVLDEDNGIARVVLTIDERPFYIDFASFSEGIEEDLKRRDFTIDAMAVDLDRWTPESLQLIDPFAGKYDLENKILRKVTGHIFKDDPSRLLRGVRLAAELALTIEPSSETLIKKECHLVREVPGEKIRDDLLRVLTLSQSERTLRYLDELGLLTGIMPEVGAMKNVEQPKEHYWNVFDHSLATVAATEYVLRETGWPYYTGDLLNVTPWSNDIFCHFNKEVSSGSTHRVLTKLAALLHDIAKPETKAYDETGRTRFLGHGKLGAETASNILQRLRFSNREVEIVGNMVYHHLRPAQMSNEGMPTARAIYRYFRDTGDAGIDTLFLALADYLATRGPMLDIEEWTEHCRIINHIIEQRNLQQTRLLPVKLVDGHDLIRTFDLCPGPIIGKLLGYVREAQVAGEVTTTEQALDLVRRELNSSNTS